MGSIDSATNAPIALFGIDNSGIGVAANLLVVFLVAVWLALVFWAYADARRRLTDPVLVGSAALAALIFPFAGALVYAIVRPPETLDDAYERELDVRAAELRVRLLESAVKGGPGSGAHAASLGAEVTGEPQARRESTPPSQAQRKQQQQASPPRSGAQRQSGGSGAQRPTEPRRPSSGGESRPPAGAQ